MRYSFLPVLIVAVVLTPAALVADERLDQILHELQALRSHVAALEERVAELEQVPAPASAIPEADGQSGGERRNWFDSMRVELQKAEVRASGAWTEARAWEQLAEGMTEEEAVELLGEPTRRKFSIRKDTDEILIYEGDLHASGQPVHGEVRIYKGKVRRWETPQL